MKLNVQFATRCYRFSVVNDRYQLDVQGKTILPEKTCPNEKISTSSARKKNYSFIELWACFPLLLPSRNAAIQSHYEAIV